MAKRDNQYLGIKCPECDCLARVIGGRTNKNGRKIRKCKCRVCQHNFCTPVETPPTVCSICGQEHDPEQMTPVMAGWFANALARIE